ncbi:hypothetical protein [Catenulispora pinisilvae]|uniref:hypothetical protein n=1 Tax=Catenulispora pinisilvae TaxID=2705253 RepID=UPI001890D00D|nr:hypothetical protein [Catenulispora pinisilvae]
MGSTVYEVVRDVVAQAAPEEAVLVVALGRLDQRQVARLLRGRHRDERVGFGLEGVLAVVTPVVWIVVDEASRTAASAATRGLGAKLRVLMRRFLRRRPRLPAEVPALSAEQLDAVHSRILDAAHAAGLKDATAVRLADHVLARLMLDRLPHPPVSAAEDP